MAEAPDSEAPGLELSVETNGLHLICKTFDSRGRVTICLQNR